MEQTRITELILDDRMVLYGQPKWTFGKNTCNTYEVFVEYFRMEDGSLLPAWPILEIVERDNAMTMLFSTALLWKAIRATQEISSRTNVHLTLSLNLLPLFAESPNFLQQVRECLNKTGFDPKRLQFEISELQDLDDNGVKNLNELHDELGVALVMGNFGTKHTNVPLLYKVHFDGLELDRSFSALIPENEMACKIVVAIQHMALTTDMYMCVKGIENQDQFEFYEDIGCLKGQGPLIGDPLTMEELEKYVAMYAKPITT